MSTSSSTAKNTPSVPATKKEPLTTTKVKRKTNDPPPTTRSSTKNPVNNATSTTVLTTKQLPVTTTTAVVTSTTEITSTTEDVEKISTTDQPDGTVKIVINGTINCTAELSSTTVPLNGTMNDTEKIKAEGHMRTPINKMDIEAMTEYPNDIITDRNVNGGFDENEMFTINVTSSLRTNNSLSTSRPSLTTTTKVVPPVDLGDALNSSKKTKEDYDYDYTEPTLPPSLPNLKIIPFVAADAVVDDDTSKETLTYPMLEREDKFPVYYPAVDTKEIPYATRREDVYPPTQYPVFVSDKVESPQYPTLTEDVDLPNLPYPGIGNDLSMPEHDYTISTSIGANVPDINKAVTKIPTTSSTFGIKTPSVNLFSPPVETEGGFIPKGPGIIDEYYAVYPSTPSAPSVPHLTTSMQLDITKGECISGDGRHVLEGDSISLACSVCTCAWGELHCAPRACHTPPGCTRRPATTSSVDLCCGELLCEQDKKTNTRPNLLIDIKKNETKVFINNQTAITEDVKPSIQNPVASNDTVLNNGTKDIQEDKYNRTAATYADANIETTTVSTNITSTDKMYTSPPLASTTNTAPVNNVKNESGIQNHDYDDEEEDDEGFSFGSVLKLLLSDNYETTTNAPYTKKFTTTAKVPVTYRTTTIPSTTTRRLPPKPPLVPFIPMPHHQYIPPKNTYNQNTVNRIDHLVLGEATAIKKTTPRPLTTPFKAISSFRPVTTRQTTTQKPYTSSTTRYTEPTKKVEESSSHTPVMHKGPRPPSSSALPLPGILKLAGCNIYGRMYRVGRIITELSTPCQECWCTELGVQCNSLSC
ncbi:mucin-2 [Ostrinia nubilalis]|uniref:mucin-2 n=1 Tax=Ostrinia nubilalis TaxID=29057 RepID=UPI00308250FE